MRRVLLLGLHQLPHLRVPGRVAGTIPVQLRETTSRNISKGSSTQPIVSVTHELQEHLFLESGGHGSPR
jgi:hypothetical protein